MVNGPHSRGHDRCQILDELAILDVITYLQGAFFKTALLSSISMDIFNKSLGRACVTVLPIILTKLNSVSHDGQQLTSSS